MTSDNEPVKVPEKVPHPTEETLLNMVSRDFPLPTGRILRIRMSEWHWSLLNYLDFRTEEKSSLLYRWYSQSPDYSDETFSNGCMLIIRDHYTKLLANPPRWVRSNPKDSNQKRKH